MVDERNREKCIVHSQWPNRIIPAVPTVVGGNTVTLHSITETCIYTTFETVKTEVNYTTSIYEADTSSQVKYGTGSFWSSAPTSATYGYSGSGYYDMAGTADYLEFNVSISTSGIYPISFRYSQGSTSYNGDRKLQLQVNGNIVDIIR
jgi:hypothetical protein